MSSLRIGAWAALMTLGAVILTETSQGQRLVDSEAFLLYVTTCSVWGLQLAQDHWSRRDWAHHSGRLHFAVLVLSALAGAAMGRLCWNVVAPRVQTLHSEAGGIVDDGSHLVPSDSLNAVHQVAFQVSEGPGAPRPLLKMSNEVSSAQAENLTNDASVARVDLSLTNEETVRGSARPTAHLHTRLAVTNRGPVAATRVQVTNTFSHGMRLLEARPSQGGCSLRGAVVTCALGTIDPGVTVVIRHVVNPQGREPQSSMATVTATEMDPNPANNAAVLRFMGAP